MGQHLGPRFRVGVDKTTLVRGQHGSECFKRRILGQDSLPQALEQYKAEFFDSVALSADDELFEMAALVNSKLDEEMFSAR